MKIVNIKLSLPKLVVIVTLALTLVILVLAVYHFTSSIEPKETIYMDESNYTSILKDCHDNLQNYAGKKISAVGYIYRASDFTEKQFVVARDMVIKYPNDIRIVGFLCESENAKNFENNSWVEIVGTITKGSYNGEMPIIKIEKIEKTETPNDAFVYPPNKNVAEFIDYAVWHSW